MQRQRLTITLKKDLIDILDTYIDGADIRNRSHAIESILSQKLHPRIKKAVILAADEGIKFRPFTYETPKAMLPIKGRPLLEHIIVGLRDQGITDLYVSVGHLFEKITSYFSDGSKFGVRIIYVAQERNNLGTGGALANFKKYIGRKEAFFLIYGDVLSDVNYQDMAHFYFQHRDTFATVALTTVAQPQLWGVVKMKGHNIVEFMEKPEKKQATTHTISAGNFLLTADIFKYLKPQKKMSFESDVLQQIVQKEEISGYMIEGRWYDISTPEVYARVLKEWL